VTATLEPVSTSSAAGLVTTATSQPALKTGLVMLGLASLVDLSKIRHGSGDRMLAASSAAVAGWCLVEGLRRR
jgi:hypothetical protein